MSDVDHLKACWDRALENGALPQADLDRLRADWPGSPKPGTEGDNRRAVAACCYRLCGKEWPWGVDLSGAENHLGDWPAFVGAESLSPLYTGWWWSLAAYYSDDRFWRFAKPAFIAHALAGGPVPTKIELVTPRGESQRAGGDIQWPWGGNALSSSHPGGRFLWADPLDASTLITRAPHNPLMSLACGRPVQINDWHHPIFGLCLWTVLKKRAVRPSGWGPPLKVGREAVAHLAEMPPLLGNQWVRYRWYGDGSRAIALSGANTSTRGTVNLSITRGDTVTYYTAAQPKGGGSWHRGKCALDASGWRLTSSAHELPAVPEPGSPELAVIWDNEGARIESAEPEPVPPAIPEIETALVAADAGLAKLGNLGYKDREQRGRTAFEVINRICGGHYGAAKVGTKSSALQGTQTLEADMVRNEW